MADATGHPNKVLSLDEFLIVRDTVRAHGETLVHCHGCFDIVHPGHIRHLRHAASLGDRLLVTLTADMHVNKGVGRPLFTEDLRAENLAALGFVDWVVINKQPTATELLERVQPELYVKGAEYETNDDPRFCAERSAVENAGGRVVFSSGDVVFSSTSLVEEVGRLELINPKRAQIARIATENNISLQSVTNLLDSMRGKRVLVCGETILDTYTRCDWPDVAMEAPMLSLRSIESTSFDGGAAIVAQHLASLGLKTTLLTVLPTTIDADRVIHRLAKNGIEVIPVRSGMALAHKHRYIVGHHKVAKIDDATEITLDTYERKLVADMFDSLSANADAAIITDYGLGMFTPQMLQTMTSRVQEKKTILCGDISGKRASLLTSVRSPTLLCPTERELRQAMRDFDSSLPAVVWKLMSMIDAFAIAVTLGEDGVIVFTRNQAEETDSQAWAHRVSSVHIPSLAGHVKDTLGCGDALLAAVTASLVGKTSLIESMLVGSAAAAAEASMLGNIAVTRGDILRVIRQWMHDGHDLSVEPKPMGNALLAG
ncbi:MAG: adenylyltransferase/cytidyltransferase family protein [Phycisphaeraceae bacterium]|nr:adenylyltransferase/cytidyltransferase family protein [Phycisphaerales bacterium]MCB9861574.1 adenylyltransferase/cytidyltransferase family protein [Phycisphaeraceae bacterium]